MPEQDADDNHRWWPRVKDGLAILFVIALVILVGWIFVLEGIHG